MVSDRRVFITHSSLDKELAEALVDYVRLATGLSPDMVFCTSIDGCGIPTGARFMSFIQDQLRNTKLVVPVITPAYLDSVFCQWELGAVWVRRGLPIFPLRVQQVDHSLLPAPLAQLQIAEVNAAGLSGLAREIARVFELKRHDSASRKAEEDLVARYPSVLETLEPAWATTPQAKLRRSARHASAAKFLHRALHTQRDASFLLVIDRTASPHVANQFVEYLRAVTRELAEYFSEVAGTRCRVTLKQVLLESNEFYVQDIARSDGRIRTDRDLVADNTDFETILRADADYYMSNDLVNEVAQGYKNSHGVPGQGVTYRSTIVWPVRKQLASREMARQIGSPLADHDLLGFLCVDAAKANAFQEADFEIGAGIADSLYPVLLPYLTGDRLPT